MKTILTAMAAGLTTLLFVTGAAGAAPAETSAVCEGPHDFETFRVEVAPLARTVHRTEVAQVQATVYRSVNGRDDLTPAEDVSVFVALWAGDNVRGAGAVTDENGDALLSVRLGRRFPTGWVDATAHGTREPADLPCRPVREAGGTQIDRFLKVL